MSLVRNLGVNMTATHTSPTEILSLNGASNLGTQRLIGEIFVSSAKYFDKTGIICQLTPALPGLTRLSSIFHRK